MEHVKPADAPGFDRAIRPRHGRLVRLSPLVRRLVADNPGPFTFTGTGTYVVGRGKVAVIDPGPDDPAHLAALLDALGKERVSHILVTHTHRDHSPAAAPLAAATGAPTCGFGPHGAGREDDGAAAVEEGADRDFVPDIRLADGDRIAGPGWTLEALWTPGHTSNHLCFALAQERALFTGDHVMGWSTSVVVPPDGDMGRYLASLERVAARDDAVLWPTHGPPVRRPRAFVEALIAHRRGREAAILDCLAAAIGTIPEIVARLYAEIDPRLHPAAARSVHAHLLDLRRRGKIEAADDGGIGDRFRPL